MTTLNKLPNVKPDIVRMDQDWESWDMDKLIENLQNWLRRNKIEGTDEPVERKERHWYTGEGRRELKYAYIVTVKIIEVINVLSLIP